MLKYIIILLSLGQLTVYAQSTCGDISHSELIGFQEELDPEIFEYLIENGFEEMIWYWDDVNKISGEFKLFPFTQLLLNELFLVNVGKVLGSDGYNYLVLVEKQNGISVVNTFGPFYDDSINLIAYEDIIGNGTPEIMISFLSEHYKGLALYQYEENNWRQIYSEPYLGFERHQFIDLTGNGRCEIIKKVPLPDEMTTDLIGVKTKFEHYVVHKLSGESYKVNEELTLELMKTRIEEYETAIQEVQLMSFDGDVHLQSIKNDVRQNMLIKLDEWMKKIERHNH